MGDVVALALGGDLAAVHQGVADHEVDQGRRDAQFLGDVLLWHAVQAVHLEGVAGALGQLGEGIRDVFEGRVVDVRGFRRGAWITTFRPSSSGPEYFCSSACLR